ncbi:MAG: DUF2997 domain-containing protein [Elainellaceae cyanobacterium]
MGKYWLPCLDDACQRDAVNHSTPHWGRSPCISLHPLITIKKHTRPILGLPNPKPPTSMADYQRIEYRITSDGTVTETVLNATGASCTTTTSGIEHALGELESQEHLPSYYEGDELLLDDVSPSLKNQQT